MPHQQEENTIDDIVQRFGGDFAIDGIYRSLHDNVSIEHICELFSSSSVGLYKIAQDLLRKQIEEPVLQEHVAAHIAEERTGTLAILRILATLNLPKSDVLKEALLEKAQHGDTIHAEAAAKVVALRYKSEIPKLLENPTSGILHGLHFAQDTSLIEPLLKAWGVEDNPDCEVRPPVGLGLLVNQYALAKLWMHKPYLGYAVARAYGYIDDSVDIPNDSEREQYCELLSRGFMCVDPVYFNYSQDELKDIERQFIRTLMPWSTGMTGDMPKGFAPKEKLWQLLLLSAVRESEATNFDIKRDELPYTQHGQENIKWAEFSFMPMSYGKRELFTKAFASFDNMGIASTLLPQYVLEYAVCRLERDSRAQEEQLLYLESRWALVSQTGKGPEKIVNFPLCSYEDARGLCNLVLPKTVRDSAPLLETVTRGAHSLQKLLRFTDREEIVSCAVEVDNHARSILPTIGIEIQCPFSEQRRSESVAWKQALRFFDIPSPRRPEYRQMVEAAFNPAYSFQIHVASILLLKELGFFQMGSDMALHISVAAELSDEVGYLLFAQQCIQKPSKNPIGSWLMSKGFVHLHEDAVSPVYSESEKGERSKRTELRSMRIIDSDLCKSELPECLDDIACMHLLVGALSSPVPALHRHWEEFKESVDTLVKDLPDSIHKWLHANWFERVGDSFDPRLMHTLPIMKVRKEALAWIREHKRRDILREEFIEVRNRHARNIFETMPRAAVYNEHKELFSHGRAGIPLFSPVNIRGASDT